jgi:lipid-A-disaccharide synthase
VKYYLIAGEASGDLHGSNLMRGLKGVDPHAQFRYFGGDFMKEQGGDLVMHYRHGAFMGIWEVVKNLGTISKNLNLCKSDIRKWQPDVVILIDYAGFNLKIAAHARILQIPVFYYISPKVWVWKESRVKKIKELVDRMFVIFPFEVDFYKKHHYKAYFAGNPLIDAIEEKMTMLPDEVQFRTKNNLPDKRIIALVPGSRKQEIELCLPEMLRAVEKFPQYQVVIAGAPSMSAANYQSILRDKNIPVLFGQTYDILKNARAAVVTSGTATLETALLNVPQVVCYKAGTITYEIGRHIVKVKFFSLVNIIMDQEVVKELLQKDLSRRISEELEKLLHDEQYRSEMFENYKQLRAICGGSGASRRVAEMMMNELKGIKNQSSINTEAG